MYSNATRTSIYIPMAQLIIIIRFLRHFPFLVPILILITYSDSLLSWFTLQIPYPPTRPHLMAQLLLLSFYGHTFCPPPLLWISMRSFVMIYCDCLDVSSEQEVGSFGWYYSIIIVIILILLLLFCWATDPYCSTESRTLLMLLIRLFVQGIESQLYVTDTPLHCGRPECGRRLHDIHIRL